MIVMQNATVGQFICTSAKGCTQMQDTDTQKGQTVAQMVEKNFYAKIRATTTGIWLSFRNRLWIIPDSEKEMAFRTDKIEEKMLILEQMKEEDPDGKNMITRQTEREINCWRNSLPDLQTMLQRNAPPTMKNVP